MTPMQNRIWLAIALSVIITILCLTPATPQSNQEVAPYKITDLPSDGVYKMVHHGCALYIGYKHNVEINHGDSVTIALATGEGCR